MTKRPSTVYGSLPGQTAPKVHRPPVVSIPSSPGRYDACIRDLFPGHKLAAGEAWVRADDDVRWLWI